MAEIKELSKSVQVGELMQQLKKLFDDQHEQINKVQLEHNDLAHSYNELSARNKVLEDKYNNLQTKFDDIISNINEVQKQKKGR